MFDDTTNVSHSLFQREIWHFTIILFLLSLSAFQQQSESKKQFKPWVGKWVLVKAMHEETGEFHLNAIFHFYQNGTFAKQISYMNRPSLASEPKTLEEYKSAFNSYSAGFGTYSVNDTEGTLHYEYIANLRPHRIGQPSSFYIQVIGDTMQIKLGKVIEIFKREL